jgi:hypothetical protein
MKDDSFAEFDQGVSRRYYDPELGILNYKGRTFIRSEATSFVRDGTQFIVYLPSENKIISRPAMSDEDSFVEIDFDRSGIWRSEFTREIKLFGAVETVSISRNLMDENLVTRRNGEILIEKDGAYEPYLLEDHFFSREIVRIDLEIKREDKSLILTIFFEIKSTAGARAWVRHFTDARTHMKKISPVASPFLRNYNVGFYNGEPDLEHCVDRIKKTVQSINETYVSDLDSSDSGKLHGVSIDSVSSDLLNQLHYEFENFGDRCKGSSGELRNNLQRSYGPFCQLNDHIHATEIALENRNKPIEQAQWALHASFLPDFYAPLQDELYEEFTTDWNFGTLFMGYHTLGKDILAAYWNNDMDLFTREEVRPQRISSSEIFLYLGRTLRDVEKGMREWWDRNNIHEFGYRWGDPRNSLGYIPVASIIDYSMDEISLKNRLKPATDILGVDIANI